MIKEKRVNQINMGEGVEERNKGEGADQINKEGGVDEWKKEGGGGEGADQINKEGGEDDWNKGGGVDQIKKGEGADQVNKEGGVDERKSRGGVDQIQKGDCADQINKEGGVDEWNKGGGGGGFDDQIKNGEGAGQSIKKMEIVNFNDMNTDELVYQKEMFEIVDKLCSDEVGDLKYMDDVGDEANQGTDVHLDKENGIGHNGSQDVFQLEQMNHAMIDQLIFPAQNSIAQENTDQSVNYSNFGAQISDPSVNYLDYGAQNTDLDAKFAHRQNIDSCFQNINPRTQNAGIQYPDSSNQNTCIQYPDSISQNAGHSVQYIGLNSSSQDTPGIQYSDLGCQYPDYGRLFTEFGIQNTDPGSFPATGRRTNVSGCENTVSGSQYTVAGSQYTVAGSPHLGFESQLSSGTQYTASSRGYTRGPGQPNLSPDPFQVGKSS